MGKGYALLFEMGCGKSLTAVAIAGQLYIQGLVRRALVVAPLAVVPVWPREFQDYAGFEYTVTPLEGSGEKKRKSLAGLGRAPGLQVAVVNYESAWRMEKELAAFGPGLIICDESQRIKDPTSKQSKAIQRLGSRSRYNLILTGTPVTNSPLDFYGQYAFLDPSVFGEPSWYTFRAKYAILGQEVNHSTGKSYTRVIGYRNLPELVERAHSVAYRVTKERCLDLPEAIDQYLYCSLEPEARRAYHALRKESVAELEGLPAISARHVITKLLRLSQIAGGFVRVDVDGYEDDPNAGKVQPISRAKLALFEDTARELLEAGKKFVVFAHFTAEIRAIVAALAGLAGAEAVRLIDGSVPGGERGAAVKDFQERPEVRAFVAQIQTVGLGITLTAADTAIFYSYDYSYANYAQAKARIHRIGQRNPCAYLHLVARGTVDEDVLTALKHKGNVAELCVDNWRGILRE